MSYVINAYVANIYTHTYNIYGCLVVVQSVILLLSRTPKVKVRAKGW